MDAPNHPQLTIELQKPKIGFWQKLGGTSLTIAVIIHLIILTGGTIWIFQRIYEPEKKVDFLPPGGGGGQRGTETKVNQKKRQQITPTANVKRVFAEGAESNFAIPDPGDNFGEMSALSSLASAGPAGGLGGKDFGSVSGNGSGLGIGAGAGKLFGLIPENMRKRCSKEDRLDRLKENGGTPACEEAVVKALRWLKANQNPDGSWGKTNKPAITGLVLLSYFGHCETPASEEFGDSSLKGIVYLVNVGMKNKGRMATNFTENGWCYEHGIATYALGEATTFCKDLKLDIPNLRQVTDMAAQFIIDNQNDNGGWAYLYTKKGGHTDSSVVGWQIQALKACSHAGLNLKGINTCINKGLKFIDSCQDVSGGYGYTTPKSIAGGGKYYTLTGVGMLCNQMWDKGNRSEVRKAAKYIKENSKFDFNTENSDLYCHYYESQAMMQMGGEYWLFYNNLYRDQMLKNQNPDGSWKMTKHKGHNIDDAVYRTALCTLMMEVYYRFLSTGGSGGNKNVRDRSGI